MGRRRSEWEGRASTRGRAALLVALLCVSCVAIACQTAPARAWQAGRLFTSGTAALDRGDHARAIASLEEAARLVPHASEVRNHLGLAYLGSGQPERARAAFARAIELDCDNDAARTNLARLEASVPEAARGAGGEADDGG